MGITKYPFEFLIALVTAEFIKDITVIHFPIGRCGRRLVIQGRRR